MILSKDIIKNNNLQKTYGISVEQYDKMFYDQNGLCAICLKPEPQLSKHGKIRDLAVDHSHAGNYVRALLCGDCNFGLAHFKDNVSILGFAISYLIKHDHSDDLKVSIIKVQSKPQKNPRR
jgi:hypothetical protein